MTENLTGHFNHTLFENNNAKYGIESWRESSKIKNPWDIHFIAKMDLVEADGVKTNPASYEAKEGEDNFAAILEYVIENFKCWPRFSFDLEKMIMKEASKVV